MELKTIKEYLPKVFTTIKIDKNVNGHETERIVFNSEIMKTESEYYPIYRAISDAQHDSGLTFDFSYKIANKAVDILSEIEDWENGEIHEQVDNAVPVYTYELMTIYNSDSWAVDEAVKEMGSDNGDNSEGRAKLGWYQQIEQMTEAIKSNLLELVEEK